MGRTLLFSHDRSRDGTGHVAGRHVQEYIAPFPFTLGGSSAIEAYHALERRGDESQLAFLALLNNRRYFASYRETLIMIIRK